MSIEMPAHFKKYSILSCCNNPALIKNEDNFLIKMRLNFPEFSIENLEKDKKGSYFYLKTYKSNWKRKIVEPRGGGYNFEPFQSRIYTMEIYLVTSLGKSIMIIMVFRIEKYFIKS